MYIPDIFEKEELTNASIKVWLKNANLLEVDHDISINFKTPMPDNVMWFQRSKSYPGEVAILT